MKELIEELKKEGHITINKFLLPEFLIELGKETEPLECRLDYGIFEQVMISLKEKEEDQKPFENYRDMILKEYEKGNIVVLGPEGAQVTSLKECVKQHTDGLLYDLNRDEATVLTFINDPKWVNDYAVAKVIRELKRQLEEPKDEEVK
jgi:hypothetical protein